MIYCKELKQNFESKEFLFKALLENEKVIIDSKKAQIYKSIDKGLQITTDQVGIEKALGSDANKGLKFDNNYYYIVVNSSNILDSHQDMHIDGNWKKTVKEQQGKVYLVFDHTLKRSEIIAMQKDIEMFTAKIPFSMLGKNYDGETYSLIYKIAKDKIINKEAKEWLELGHKMEASVRMQYVTIEAAFNAKDKDYEKQKKNYDDFYPIIANKEEFEEIDYFWIVKEAKNVYESSLVLFGSNSATGVINQENKEEIEPSKDTLDTEPSIDTQKQSTRRRRN